MERKEGRKGQWNEYVEFVLGPRKPRYVAQCAGEKGWSLPEKEDWFVYVVAPGRDATTTTLSGGLSREAAVKKAEEAAMLYVEGGGTSVPSMGSKSELELALRGLLDAVAYNRAKTVMVGGADSLQSDVKRAMIALGELPRPKRAKRKAAQPRLSR